MSEQLIELLLVKHSFVSDNAHTLTGAGHLRTVSTNTGCNRWLSLAKLSLKVTHAHTGTCGWAIRSYFTM